MARIEIEPLDLDELPERVRRSLLSPEERLRELPLDEWRPILNKTARDWIEDPRGVQQRRGSDAGVSAGRIIVFEQTNPRPRPDYARRLVRDAVGRGEVIKPKRCQECGAVGPVQAHHLDPKYLRWREVEWLCQRCHGLRHTHMSPTSSVGPFAP